MSKNTSKQKSKTVIDVVGDSISDCIKATANQFNDGTDTDSFTTYISGILGGTILALFSPTIGIPIILLSTTGGVMDVLLSKDKAKVIDVVEESEEVKIPEVKMLEDEDAIKYDIFKCIGCRNAMKEYPEFLRMQEGGYVYSRPEGITLGDIKDYAEEICLALNLQKMEVCLLDSKSILIKEYVDKIGHKQSYVNHKRDTHSLIAYVGAFLDKKGVLKPLDINFTKNNHMMVASTSGWGKSSLLRTLIVDMMLNYSPDELKFYFIDMKMTELVLFEDYKHCVGDCITEHGDIVPLLEKLKEELVERKRKIKSVKLNNIYQYNEKYLDDKMPYIILVIDELYEVVVGKTKDHKEIGELLALLLSQGRAFGMYFVLSTQHPSRKLIDASIQSNVAQRIGLKVQSETDSDVVFPGARIPLHDIGYKGRGYFGGLDGSYTEFQSYYIGDPDLKNEPEVIAELLRNYLKEDRVEVGSVDLVDSATIMLGEVAQTVDKPNKVKSNKDIREMLYGKDTKNENKKNMKIQGGKVK